jgi:dipeptidyl aminopeptidase/acylaminoacyl peptidase
LERALDLQESDRRFIEQSLERESLQQSKTRVLRNQALSMQSRFLADLARQCHSRGDYRTAIALALEALPDKRRDLARPYVAAAELSLYRGIIALQDNLRQKGEDIPQLRITFRGHQNWINSVAFSSDGRLVVTASSDGTARIWEATNGKQIAVFEPGHDVKSASFSPDRMYVVMALTDNSARIWDAAAANEKSVLQGHSERVNTAVFSPDGTRVLTSSRDGTARLWSVEGADCTNALQGHGAAVRSAEFSFDGRHVVTASEDKTARIWDVETGTEISILYGHTGQLNTAAFSRDNQLVVTGSGDLTTRIWEVETGKCLSTFGGQKRTGATVNIASFSPDGRRVLTGSGDATSRVWDLASSDFVAMVRGDFCCFSPDGRKILSAYRHHQGSLIEVVARIRPFFPTTQELIDHVRSIMPFELSPEQRVQFFLADSV